MADWPTTSPEVWEDVNQNQSIQQLVIRMVEATRAYLVEWDAELMAMEADVEQGRTIESFMDFANSVQEVVEQLQLFREQGIELQAEGLAEFMRQSEEAFQDMQERAEQAGEV